MKSKEEVKQFVRKEHDKLNHKRSNGDPYWTHVERVAKIVSDYYKGEANHDTIYYAALAHDLKEDTKVSSKKIKSFIGEEAFNLVIEVTNVYTKKKYPKLKRKERKILEAKRLGKISFEGKIIKISDMIDNLSDVKVNRPKMAGKYIQEKKMVIEEMVKDMPHIMRSKPYLRLKEVFDKLDA